MITRSLVQRMLLTVALIGLVPNAPARAADENKSRTFRFTYAATIVGLLPRQRARVWIPLPSGDRDQKLEILEQHFPAETRIGRDPVYANKMISFDAAAGVDGAVPFSIAYLVTRHAAGEEPPESAERRLVDQSLQADKLVPVGGRSLTLIAGKKLPDDGMKLGRLLYDVVDDHMQYRKDKPGWGRGDAAWACESGFGNCTDFHSLFMSLARAEHLPAKFQIGFLLPEARGRGDVGGYHCWAWFLPGGHGWVPVDISEANQHPDRRDYLFSHLDANRVAFTTGRDLELDPRQDGPPVNFFVYPYVEVEGKPCPAENIKRKFSYEDAE